VVEIEDSLASNAVMLSDSELTEARSDSLCPMVVFLDVVVGAEGVWSTRELGGLKVKADTRACDLK